MILINVTASNTVAKRLMIAETSLTRLIGLLGKKQLAPGCGLLIRPSAGVHTFGMLFPIDVVALSKDLRVLRLWRALAPYRMTGLSLKTYSVLELPAGQIDATNLKVGDQLKLRDRGL